jgi:hypothetical protein
MKQAHTYFGYAAISTAVYEVLVSAPWWSGMRQDGYDMLLNLTVPSMILLVFTYYLLQKKQPTYVGILTLFIVVLQAAVLITIYGTMRGILP